jgi:S-layer protein (TIGR01567 family)
MNKKIIVPLALVALMVLAMVGAASAASADEEVTTLGSVEIRGTIAEFGAINNTIANSAGAPLYIEDVDLDKPGLQSGFQWDYSSFAGFWYDLDDDLQTEHLTILQTPPAGEAPLEYKVAGATREIAEGGLIYTTHPVFQEYELHQDIEPSPPRGQTDMEADYDAFFERGIGSTGLCVESDNAGGDCGYFIEGWMAEKYVAIDGNADELCKLLVEFEDDDKKTLSTGEEWDLGGGFSLTANQIDLEGDKVWFSLKKDGREIDNEVASTGGVRAQERVYTYTADLAQEDDIPVFSCYVDAVFRGTDSNVVQVMYVFLIDDDVLEIETSDTYGSMEVSTASSTKIVLDNDETTIDLDLDTREHIMGNMYFQTADDDLNDDIRFYPYVEYTIGEGAAAAEEEEEEAPPTEVVTPEANVTPTEVVTPAPEPTAAIAEETAAPAETAAPEETEAPKKKTPGFEAVFAIAGLLAVAYLVLRQRE